MLWWCSGQGCGAQSVRCENRFLAWAPSSLNNLKVNWLKIERKGLPRTEKPQWCSGGAVVLWCSNLKGEDRLPAGPRPLLRWFQSGRNRIGRMKKVWLFSNWHGGVMVEAVVHQALRGRGSIPSWAKSTFKFTWFKSGRKGL